MWDYNTLIANIQAYMAQKGEWRPKEENSFTPALCNRIDPVSYTHLDVYKRQTSGFDFFSSRISSFVS